MSTNATPLATKLLEGGAALVGGAFAAGAATAGAAVIVAVPIILRAVAWNWLRGESAPE